MARVTCEIEHVELEGEHGKMIPSVCATCSECGHTTESHGQHDRSVRRCLVLMREQCPQGEENFYVAEDGSDT